MGWFRKKKKLVSTGHATKQDKMLAKAVRLEKQAKERAEYNKLQARLKKAKQASFKAKYGGVTGTIKKYGKKAGKVALKELAGSASLPKPKRKVKRARKGQRGQVIVYVNSGPQQPKRKKKRKPKMTKEEEHFKFF